jgi:hypothetical protein
MAAEWRMRILKRCRLCRRLRRHRSFIWQDRQGNTGESARCKACRNRPRQRNPALPTTDRYWIRPHAVRRYIERCAPGLTFAQARDEMRIRMHDAPLVPKDEGPAWCSKTEYKGRNPQHLGYLLIDDDTVFALSRYRTMYPGVFYEKVATVLVRNRAEAETPIRSLQPHS